MTLYNLNKTKSFLIPILSLAIGSILLIATITAYISINSLEVHIKKDMQEYKEKYLASKKDKIYKKVHLVQQSIDFQLSKLDDKIKTSLTHRINTAIKVADYLYKKNKSSMSKEKIKHLIARHLNLLRFNKGLGYYYLYDYKTNIVYGHAIKRFIGKDMTNFKDLRCQNLVKLYSNALKKDKIAFCKIYFEKPNDTKNEHSKITAITKYKPLDLVIGTGVYIDEIEKDMKKYILDRFKENNLKQVEYLFIYDLHNINGGKEFATMILNQNRPDLIGKKIDDNYKDAKGKQFRKEFLKGLRQNGEVYTKYWYKKPNMDDPKPKMSYFYLHKKWNWVIASGFYYDDYYNKTDKMKKEFTVYTGNIITDILLWTGLLLVLVIAIAIYVSISIDKKIKQYTDQIIEHKDNERRQEKLIQEQAKMVQMGEMIANIAHQWRQPLSAISMSASGMQIEKETGILTDERFLNYTDGIIKNTEYLSNIIDIFRNYIREKKVLKTVILQERIHGAINIVSANLKHYNITLHNNIDKIEPIEITMVVGELSQVIINIINNAIDVLKEKAQEDKIVTINLKKENNTAIITIEDNGGGISEDILPKIFDPYFTTKYKKQGTGLGLHMSKDIIESHLKGSITATNGELGAIFTIKLPLS
jgi:signal transduction histidine kinase